MSIQLKPVALKSPKSPVKKSASSGELLAAPARIRGRAVVSGKD
jgi:hypothetical protein